MLKKFEMLGENGLQCPVIANAILVDRQIGRSNQFLPSKPLNSHQDTKIVKGKNFFDESTITFSNLIFFLIVEIFFTDFF